MVLIISGRVIDQKLQVAGLAKFSLAPGDKPYKIAAYIPGSKVKDNALFAYTYMCISVSALKSQIICNFNMENEYMYVICVVECVPVGRIKNL